jgi:hypothetical protein
MLDASTGISRNLTVPLTDLVRANVSGSRVALPVQGSVYARLNHISAVPARSSDAGYSLSRLRAIDSMIARIARAREAMVPDVAADPVEQKEAILEEVARLVEESLEAGPRGSMDPTGFVLNLVA